MPSVCKHQSLTPLWAHLQPDSSQARLPSRSSTSQILRTVAGVLCGDMTFPLSTTHSDVSQPFLMSEPHPGGLMEPGSPGWTRSWVPAPLPVSCITLGMAPNSLNLGFLQSPTGIILPFLGTLGGCFNNQHQRIEEGSRRGGEMRTN